MTSQELMFARLKAALPQSWFGDNSPNIDALMNAFAWLCGMVYDGIQTAALQLRIKSATGAFLDMISGDFFGVLLLRSPGESDTQFRARVLAQLFRERATRLSVHLVIKEITGLAPKIFEPKRPADTGAYRAPNSGYGLAGGYGSMLLPFQCFVTVKRPPSSGIPFIAGYGCTPAGYGIASQGKYVSSSMVNGYVADDTIMKAIDSVKPVGTVVWTKIEN